MMKWFALILLISLLAACAQVPPANNQSALTPTAANPPTQIGQPGATASPTPSSGIVNLTEAQTQAAQSNNVLPSSNGPESPAPSIEWKANPATVVINATNCCGLATPFYQDNYIPDALVWGDGRILWTETGASGNRQVLQSQLSPTQLHNWLQSAADAGFFGWKGLYKNDLSPTDLPTRCIAINLTSQEKRVCEYQQAGPEAFHNLYDQLSQGLGAGGTPFVPQRAYLTAHSFPKINPGKGGGTPAGKTPLWNEKAAGVSLANAGNGVWLEGASLKQVWEMVNQNPMAPMAMENGQLYQLTLQVPGVSIAAPPAQ